MLYPKKINSKKIDKMFKIISFIVILLSIVLLIINRITTPNIYWSHLSIFGFIYIYFTVKYSVTRTTNIANYVMIQTIFLALLMYFIDYRIGYTGWSLKISIPILIIISNIAMFIITLFSFKHYGKYAISQLIIVILSLSIIYFIYKGYVKENALIKISIIISIFNFLVSLILCHRDFKEEIIKKFNI